MKTNWQTKELSEIKSIIFMRGNGLNKSLIEEDGKFNCILYGDLYTKYKHPIIKKVISKTNYDGKIKSMAGDVLVPGTTTADAYGIAIARSIKIDEVVLGGDINILRTKNQELLSDYLSYFLNGPAKLELSSYATGTNIMHLSNRNIKKIQIFFPPLPEQHRIVKILDEVFENIAKAKENVEKNLKNSKNLFESYLQSVFANPGKDWEEKEFEDSIEKVVYTNKIQRNKFLESGEYPVVSQEKDLVNGYWDKEKDLFHIKSPVIVFGDHTQILKYIDFDFVLGADGVKILQPKEFLFPKFFYYFLKSIKLKSLGYARHYRLFKEKQVFYPKSLTEQKSIVAKLDALSNQTKKLEEIYKQKLADLEELKKSVLKKAFSGKL